MEKMARDINLIVVHCSATHPDQDVCVDDIRKWHLKRGFSDIGYHNIIPRDGSLRHGRDLAISGAHAKGHNKNSIGICLVGGVDVYGNAVDNFEEVQKETLRGYIDSLIEVFPGTKVVGHRDLSVDLNEDGVITPDEYMKQCPCFDVKDWYYG